MKRKAKKTDWLDPDWKVAHKLASTWVAGFWGAAGVAVTVGGAIVNADNAWWLGPLLIVAGGSFAIARFTNQPGAQ